MCGICGFTWDDGMLVRRMAESIAYRGPDQDGYYTDSGVSLGHKRLSIIDVSEKGKQPLGNEDGSVQVVFNGEIYNFREVRKELEKLGHRFATSTDTEVIVHAYEQYGNDCTKKFNGMFAFAIWDSRSKKILLARDRLGIKPLFYTLTEGGLIFASEIKAILQHDAVRRVLNPRVLGQIVDYLFPLGDDTLFKGIKELPPAHILEYKEGKAAVQRYWKLEERTEKGTERYFAEGLEKLLFKSVKGMLVSDVPLGAALSGGLDSSTVVAMMKRASKSPVKTFTVGFGEESDEFRYAKMVAEHCGTQHKEIIIPFESITAKLPEILWHMETIITRTSTFPTYFYAKELKKHVTVALIGEGSDEVFGGYPRNKPFAPDSNFDVAGATKTLFNMGFFREDAKKRLYNSGVYSQLDRESGKRLVESYMKDASKSNMLNRELAFEIEKQLPGVHLPRVDRMTMAHAVEARVPYLDHEIIEFSTAMPPRLKISRGSEKYILKKVAAKYIPREIIEREKLGLGTPVSSWFREDFFGLIPSILSEKNIRATGIFEYAPVGSLFRKSRLLRSLPAFVHSASKSLISRRASDFLKDAYASKLWFLAMTVMWHKMFIEPENVKNPKLKIGYYF